MRTITTNQRTAWESDGSITHVQVRIEDGDGFIHNWCDLLGRNWIESVDFGETQDAPGQDATITLIWRQYEDNASPWVVAGQRLEGYLGIGQRVLIDVAILPEGIEPQSGDWITALDGQIDSYNLDYPTGTIECRDRIIAQLTDRWVETDTPYGTVAGRDMEQVMQDIITDWGGLPEQTLWTPASPGFAITPYNQQAEPVLTALTTLALLTGWDLRPRWRTSAAAFQLALTEPDRAGGGSVFGLPLSRIRSLDGVGVNIDDIRNVIRVFYTDGSLTTGGQLAIKSVVRTNSASVTKYGRRFFELTEGSSSSINTLGEATALADAILADLSEPDVTATVTIPLEWWLELGDVITLQSDGERFGAAQELAIVGLRRNAIEGEATTTIQLYGKPRTGRRNWMEREARPGVAPAVSQLTPKPQLPPRGSIKIGGYVVTAEWPATSGFEAIEFHGGDTEGFTISEDTLLQLGRERSLLVSEAPGVARYYKTVVVDRFGNRSDPSEAAAGIAGYVPAPALAPAVRAVVQVQRITSTQAISASGPQTVQLQQEDFDPAGVWSVGSYWLIPLATGIYRLDVDLRLDFDSSTTYEVTFALDGGAAVWSSGTRTAVAERYQATTMVQLTAGSKYLLKLERDAGTASVLVLSKMVIEPTLAIGQDTAPLLTLSPVVSGTLEVTETLSCTSGTWTSSPTATYAYQWLRDAVAISGETASTHTLDEDDLGTMISCRVIATNRAGVATAVAVPVGPITLPAAAPTSSSAPEISGDALEGAELTTTDGVWGGYPAPTFAYQWQRDGLDIGGATASAYTLVAADVGADVTCIVTATNTSGSLDVGSNAIGPIEAAPAAPANTLAPAVSGTEEEGETLSCTTGTWTGYPAPTYAYQWRRHTGGALAAIAGATSSTYTLDAADVGHEISCIVTATNASGDSGAASNTTGSIAAAPPVNTIAPVVSGTTTEGETLSCTTGTWTGTPPITYAYQWYRTSGPGSVPISGATSSTYLLDAADVGEQVRCVVTATNAAASVDATSNSVGPVSSASGTAPVNTVAPVASGTMRLSETLSCTTGTWTGTPTPTYAYQWQRGGVDIGGATASTHTVVAADLYAEITCVVTATNASGSDDADSNALTSPLKVIWDIDPDAAIWVRTAGWSVSVGSPEGAWSTADARWTWAQASTSLKPTRVSTGLSYDGADDYSACDTLASVCDGAHTAVIGWTQGSEGATPARTVWAANSDDSSGNTYQVSLNYSRPDLTNATRMSARWAGASVVSVSLVSLGSKGAGPYLVAQVSGAQGSAARAESLDTPLVEVGTVTRPSGTATYEWLTLGAKRQGAGPSVVQPWLGVIHSYCLLALACSDAQLETIRDALAAEDAL
jgi:hypothetical protein